MELRRNLHLLENVYKWLSFIVLLTIAGCSGGESGEEYQRTNSSTENSIESTKNEASCTLNMDQGVTNLNSSLETSCSSLSSSAKLVDQTWSISSDNTCTFVSVNSNKVFSGIPFDDHVGDCELIVNTRADNQITVYKVKISVSNVSPDLIITDGTIPEDAPLTVIKVDGEIQATEEGYGVYSLDHAGTTGDKCSDNGTLSINETNGEISYDPTDNYSGTCNVKVKFNDENKSNNTISTQFLVNVVSNNDTPVISSSCATGSLDQDIAYLCNTLISADNDLTDVQTWSFDASNTCAWVSIVPTTGVITGTPTDDQVGTCTLAVKTNDGQVDSNIYSRSVTVNNVTPIIPALTTVEPINEDALATVVLLDANVNSSDEGLGVYSLDNGNTTGTKCSDNGIVAINVTTGAVTLTPAADYAGSCNVRVVFDDQNPTGNTTFAEATIVVLDVNDATVITSACALTVNELAAYTCTGAYTDVEPDTIAWSLDATNTCAWASIHPTTGDVTGTPTRAQVGACNLVITANDGTVDTDRTYAITVNNVTPVVTVADTILAEDAAATIIRTAADVGSSDEGYGTYSIAAASANDCQSHGTVTIVPADGQITFAPDVNYDQTCNINVSFDDGKPLINVGTKEFAVVMTPDPDNATVSLPAACDTNVNEDVAYTCTPTITDPDTGDTHTWSIDANTCGFIAGVTAATGVMTGTAHDDQVGACTFTIKATGDQDALVTSTLTANFSIVNVQPVITGTNPVEIFMHHTTAPGAYAAVIKNTATDMDVTSSDETHGVFSFGVPSATPCSAVADTLTLDTATGVATFLPNDMYYGTCKIKIDFDDQNGADNLATSYEYDVNVNDQVPPIISYIDSSTVDATYYLSDKVNITVKFNEGIVVNTAAGTPRIFLETGVVDREATYTGQGGADNSELYFEYEVQENDVSGDLDVHSTVGYLDLAGATVADNNTNTLPNFAIPKAADTTGNSLPERRALVIDGSMAAVGLTGLPTLVSPDLILNVDVDGPSVDKYQHKVKQVGTVNDTCADPIGYSADTDATTNITDSLVAFPLGSQIRICVVGITPQSVMTPYANAFEYIWSKDANSIEKVDFGSVTNLPNWQDSEIDPDNKHIVYARNLLGEVYKSEDYGASWVSQCTLSQTYATSMEVSPGPDRTPYAFQNGTIYKIEDKAGAACSDIMGASGISGNIRTEYGQRTIRFASNGDIYVATDAFGGVQIHRSFDQGANWSLYSTLTPVSYNQYFGFTIDPNDVSHIVYSKLSGTVDPSQGLYESTDSGATYVKIGGVRGSRLHWHPTNSNLVYRTYRAFSEKSLDGGTTWESGGESVSVYNTTYKNVRFDIDKGTGVAYRLLNSGANTKLQKAIDIVSTGSVSWSDVYTFNGYTGVDTNSKNVSVSVNVGTPAEPSISVNIANRMWTSSDGGTTFTERFAPEELKLLTIAGSGDDAIYGATKDWFVVKTTNNGTSWTYKTGDFYHCLGKPPRLQVNQLDTDNILMWTENYGTVDCDNFNYSVDAMASLVERNSFSMVAPKLSVIMSPYDPKKYYIAGKITDESFKFHKTSNSSYETTLKESAGNEFSSPMPDSFIHPHNDRIVWIADQIGNGVLYEYDLDAGTRTNITGNTGLTTIAGLDVYTGVNGQYFLRVMDRVGRMKVSSDYGATFGDEGNTGAPLTSCNKRFLYHHPKDRNLVVTACVEGNEVAISKDSGATWDETDLITEYTINCQLTGIAVSSSRMYLGCALADTMIFNYSFATLLNDATDSVITAAEHGNANDLMSHIFPGNYGTLLYAVIPAGTTCDGAVTFGLDDVIPKSNDPAFVATGEYKICIQQTDLAGDDSWTVSSTIFYDTGAPVFTSVDLINDVADSELTYVERFNENILIGNLNSSNHDFVKYAVVQSATTCDGSVSYSFEMPKSSNEAFTTNTTYKVCVELTTRGGVSTTYGASSNITYVPSQVFATLSGVPEAYVSTDTDLDITVGGTNVTQYKYKLVLSSSACTDSAGYSAATPIGTKITDDLTGFTSGDNLKLCVVGGDVSGYFQTIERRTLHQWVYSTNYRIDPIDFSSVSTMTDWRQVAIHPVNENIIYALNSMGEVWKSEDQGSNWLLQCRVPAYRNAMHLKVSPGADSTAYISHQYTSGSTPVTYSILYRVDDYNGTGCSNLIGNFRGRTESEFIHSTFKINSTGTVYHIEDQYDSIVVRKSSDQGRNWVFVSQLQDSGLNGQIYFNPLDETVMLISTKTDNTGSGTKGLYKSTDSGATWSFIQSTGFTASQSIYFDPVNANRVYSNSSYKSVDNGSTWSVDAQFNSAGGRWTVDGTGKGYRVGQVAADTVLYRSNTLNPASFTSLFNFSGIQSSDILKDHVSATGNTVAVIIGKRMFISTDAGVSFPEKFWPGRNLRLNGIASTDGEKLYAIAKTWNIFASDDAAGSWTYKTQSFSQSCENDGRIYAHHLDKNNVWAYSHSCQQRGLGSTDGFDNRNYYNNAAVSATGRFVSSSTAGKYVMVETYTNYGYLATSNSWASSSTKNDAYFQQGSGYISDHYDGPLGFSKLHEPDTYLYVKGDNTLQEVRLAEDPDVGQINSRLTFSDPATVAVMYDKDRLDIDHLVISQNGKMNISSDDGKSFSSLGTTVTGLTTSGERLFYVYPNNNNYMVTATNHGTELAWSLNKGTSWTRIDLSAYYGMNCAITGIIMNNAQIMFTCSSGYDGMSFYYTPAKLLGGASDNILTTGEANGSNIVSIDYPAKYSAIEYSIITSGGVCSAATPGFSTTIPIDTDITGLADGAYQVCVKLTDGATIYKTSTEIVFDGTAPSFTSIALANEAVDGVQLIDYLEQNNEIVDTLVGSDYTVARYSLVPEAVTCDGSLHYTQTVPRANSEFFTAEGNYRVCVALSDGVNDPAFGSSASFAYSTGQVTAVIGGAPSKISKDTVLNITISGTDVDAYQYKVGVAPLDCTDSTGYSVETLIATPITDDISGLANGSIQLCARGIDNTNFKDQLHYQASSYTWDKNTFDGDFIDFNIATFSQNWFDVEVAKWAATPHIYARDFSGKIYLSTNRGTSFSFVCSVPHDAESKMMISPVIGHGAFATAGGALYRIDKSNGEACPNISGSFTSVVSTFQRAPVAFNSVGEMYAVDEVSPTQSDLYKSNTLGESWTLIKSFTDTFTNLTINVDPFDDDNLFLVYEGGSSSYNNDYIVSKNGGETFEGVNPDSNNKSVDLIQNLRIDFKFDPAHYGYMYANNGQYSSEHLFDLSDGTGNYVDDFSRWDMDNSGVGYRLVQNGADIDYEIATDMTIVAFTFDKKILTVTADAQNRTISVSGDGATVAVVADKKMYISLDNAAFSEVFTPTERLNISSVTSEDNSVAYIVDYSWNFLKTGNSGSTWAFADNFNTACARMPRVRTSKADSNYVIAYAEDTVGTCATGYTTTDGFATGQSRTPSFNSVTQPTLAMDPTLAGSVAIIGNGAIRSSSNLFATVSEDTVTTVSNNGHGFNGYMSNLDNNLLYNIVSGNLYEIDITGGTKTDISGSLALSNAAAIEGFPDGSVYVMSRTGEIDLSVNSAGSFANYSADPALTSCNSRFVKALAADPANVIATACSSTKLVAYTLDAGATWKEINLANSSATSSCTVRDMAIVNDGANKMYLACEGSEAIYIEMN